MMWTAILSATYTNCRMPASSDEAWPSAFAQVTSKFRWPMDMHTSDPTVLWRLARGRSTAHATIFPGAQQTTVTWFFDDVMDRAENYDSVDLAIARAEHIKGVLLRDGWREA
jgi:hypothetical protein